MEGLPAELTQSVWGDMLKQMGGDKEKARDLLRGMEEQENEKAKERKIRELETNFPGTSKELIVKTLMDNNWDVEAAIVPIFEHIEKERQAEKEKEREEQAKKREEERVERKKQANERARLFLQNLFENIPEEKIQAMLDENEGDVDATTEQLLNMVKVDEEKQAMARKRDKEAEILKKQAELERRFKTDALKQKFDEYISEEEIVECLQKHNWDVGGATGALLKVSECRQVEKLRALLVTPVPEEQIKAVLIANKWNMAEAMRVLRQTPAKEPEVAKPKAQDDPDSSFMLRSAILGKELNEIIKAQQAEAKRESDPELIFKKKLEKKLRIGPEDVPGLPGMIPLTKKMIDNLRAAKPVDDDDVGEKPVARPKDAPEEKDATLGEKGQIKLTLAATPLHLDIGQKVTVAWETEGETTTSDWIGMYRADSSVDQYLTWNWIGKAQKQGSITFSPSEFGQYVFRYFSKNKSNLLATSELVTVGPQFQMNASVEAGSKKIAVKFQQQTGKVYPSAWIGMYEKSQTDNRYYHTYEWVSSAIDNALSFEAPKSGTWEFRYFPQRTYLDVARCSVSLEGKDEVTLNLEGKTMHVSVNLQTVDVGTDSVWVGIYRVAETDNRQYRKYKYATDSQGVITFAAPSTPGPYEARVFANKTLQPVCISNTVNLV